MAWSALVTAAFCLWNARQTGSIQLIPVEWITFILSAFSAFVAVFAWLLFNPGRRSAVESPSLLFAAMATLFPPPIIGFCLMPPDSPLRGWLAMGVFLLCVIAVLSHVPDDFFGVPRSRHTYLVPIPAFDRVEGDVMDPNAAWFTFSDLSRIVPEGSRPSLAPRAYLQRDETRPSTAGVLKTDAPRTSEVDDILGSDFDIGLLDDPLWEMDDADLAGSDRANLSESQWSAGKPPQSAVTRPDPRSTRRLRKEDEESRTANTSTSRRPNWLPRADTPRSSARPVVRSALGDDIGVTSGNTSTANEREPAPSTTGEQRTAGTNALSAFREETASETDERVGLPSEVASEKRGRSFLKGVASVAAYVTGAGLMNRKAAADDDSSPSADSTPPVARRDSTEPSHKPAIHPETDNSSTAVARIAESRPDNSAVQRQADSSTGPQRRPDTSWRRKQPVSETETTRQPAISPAEFSGSSTNVALETSEASGVSAKEQKSLSADSLNKRLASTPTPAVQKTAAPELPQAIDQQARRANQHQAEIRRTVEDDGTELVEGVMPVRFDAGQKRANIHIPFSPPLHGIPEVECEPVGDEPIRLKVPVRQSYGIRIEARRTNVDEPLETDIGFAALCEPQ